MLVVLGWVCAESSPARAASTPAPADAPEPEPPATESPEPEPPAGPSDDDAAEAPEGLVPPTLLSTVEVTYPESLLGLDPPPEGTVDVEFVVGTDGAPKEIKIVGSVHPEIDSVVTAAVANLRYIPAEYEGRPVEVALSIAVDVTVPPRLRRPADAASSGDLEESDAPPPEQIEAPVRIRGTLLEGGQRTPISGARILAIAAGDMKVGKVPRRKRKPPEGTPAWVVDATSGDDGSFELRDVPDGKVRLIFLKEGYERLEYVVELAPGEVLEARYYPVRLNTNPYRTVVTVEAEAMEEVGRHSIHPEEVEKIPGTQGDALKSVQNFPGVARPLFGAGLLVIRGAAPGDSAVYLGSHVVPTFAHFGGLTTVFNADLVERIDYLPGNFDSRYGDAMGGVINMKPRKGRRDGYHGYVDVDVIDAGAVVEGPVGKGSFILSGRRSYVDAILPAVVPEDAMQMTVAPRYYDYQGLFDYPVGKGNLSVRAFGSDDKLAFLFADPDDEGEADAREQLDVHLAFQRVDLEHTTRHGNWSFLLAPAYMRHHQSAQIFGVGDFDFTIHTLDTRAEATWQATKRLSWRFGTEDTIDWMDLYVMAPPVQGESLPSGDSGPEGGDQMQPIVREVEDVRAILALYTTLDWALHERFRLMPGVRVSYYTKPLSSATADPRLRFLWNLTETTQLSGGVGLYSQGVDVAFNDEVFGNPDLGPEHALHTSLGIKQEFAKTWSVGVTGFYKHTWDEVVSSPEVEELADGTVKPVLFDNTGHGRIFGGELMLRKEIGGRLYGWLAYTLSRSELQPREGEDFMLYDWDQTHILTTVVGYKLPRNWQVGLRFRVASGNPYTPYHDGYEDLANGWHTPLEPPYNSARMRAFHQLDLRVDKTWTFRLVRLTAYLDVQNVYWAKNPEVVIYSWDYHEQSTVNGLPIIPSIGLKLEF